MTDISGVPAFGGGGFAHRQPPEQPRPAVPEPAKTATDGSATFNKGSDLPGQNGLKFQLGYRKSTGEGPAPAADNPARTTAPSEGAREMRGDVDLDQKNLLTGPTPAFQASVLEVEQDLRHVIAQVEAKRTQKADEAAIAPTSPEPRAHNEGRAGASERADQKAPADHQGPPEQQAADDGANAKDSLASTAASYERAAQTPPPDREAAYAGPAATPSTPYDAG